MLNLPLNSPRLSLREFTHDDLPAYQALRHGTAFARHYAAHETSPAFSASLLQRFITQQQETPRRGWQLAIVRHDNSELIGSVGVRLSASRGEASFGIELAEHCWQQGYAQEAARLLLDTAFNRLGLHRIEADTAAANLAAIRLAQKLGFVASHKEGTRQTLALALDMLAAQTDWRLQGETAWLSRHDGYWQLACPGRPNFHFGNLLLLEQPPALRAPWEARFDAAFATIPGIRHRTFSWVRSEGDNAARYADWTAAGYHYDEYAALLLTQDHFQPVPVQPGLTIRPLHSPADWQQWHTLMLACRNQAHEEAGYSHFLADSITRYQALEAAGHGYSWGVFDDGELLACAGLYTWQALGRFQQVTTAGGARRRGLASMLLSHLAKWGLARVPRLVIVADEHYHAITLYRKLGFVSASHEASLCYWPAAHT